MKFVARIPHDMTYFAEPVSDYSDSDNSVLSHVIKMDAFIKENV